MGCMGESQQREPTIQELTCQQLLDFAVSGAPIDPRVAGHLKRMSPEETKALTSGLVFEEDANPDRRELLARISIRGAALIDHIAEPEPPVRPHSTAKRKRTGGK